MARGSYKLRFWPFVLITAISLGILVIIDNVVGHFGFGNFACGWTGLILLCVR